MKYFQIETIYNNDIKHTTVGSLIEKNLILRGISFGIMKFYNVAMMGWSITPFVHLNYNKWFIIYKNSGFWGFYLLGIWIVINLLYQFLISPRHKNPLLKDKDS